MKRFRTVKVTVQDLESGLRNNSFYCPIAQAVNRSLPVGVYSWVENQKGFIQDQSEDIQETFLVSRAAQKFIKDFDLGCDMSPTTFRFLILDGVASQLETDENEE